MNIQEFDEFEIAILMTMVLSLAFKFVFPHLHQDTQNSSYKS